MDLKLLSDEEKKRVLKELAHWLIYSCRASGFTTEDASDVSQFAIQKLWEKRNEIKAPNGIASLKAWLSMTAKREYLRLIAKEKRNQTVSLFDALSPSDFDEAQTLEDKLDDPTLEDITDASDEIVDSVNEVLKKMPARCELKRRAGVKTCKNTCDVLWTRHASADDTLTVRELSLQFGAHPRTMYDWLCECEERFQELWKEQN